MNTFIKIFLVVSISSQLNCKTPSEQNQSNLSTGSDQSPSEIEKKNMINAKSASDNIPLFSWEADFDPEKYMQELMNRNNLQTDDFPSMSQQPKKIKLPKIDGNSVPHGFKANVDPLKARDFLMMPIQNSLISATDISIAGASFYENKEFLKHYEIAIYFGGDIFDNPYSSTFKEIMNEVINKDPRILTSKSRYFFNVHPYFVDAFYAPHFHVQFISPLGVKLFLEYLQDLKVAHGPNVSALIDSINHP